MATGKIGIVTGAASGIGLAVAETLAREGNIVVMADVDRINLIEAAEKNIVIILQLI